jgi:hypothetical protein
MRREENMTVKGIQVNPRDILVFDLLQGFPLLSAERIHKACFGDTAYSAVGRRLKKLLDYGLMKRTTLLGEPHYRYYITEKVRLYVKNDRAFKLVNKNHLRHDVELYECLLDIQNAYGDAVTITPDFELKVFAKRSYRTTLEYKGFIQAFQLSFLPDALIVYNNIAYLLEYDRSTIWGVNLFKKLSAYQQYFSSEQLQFQGEVSFRDVKVIYLCQNQTRVDALIDAAQRYTSLDVFQYFDIDTWSKQLKDLKVLMP